MEQETGKTCRCESFDVVIGNDDVINGNEKRLVSIAWPAISPDGKQVVYQWQNALWIREMDKTQPRRLFVGEGVSHPFWSPRSDRVGFFYDDKLWTISYLGGAPVAVSPIPSMPDKFSGGGAWSEQDEIFFARSAGERYYAGTLFRVSAAGGDPEVFVEPQSQNNEIGLHNPSPLPENRGLVFVVSTIEAIHGSNEGQSPRLTGVIMVAGLKDVKR